ncbi:hypothetical protein N8987_05070 [Crocinitomix sp.]|nr:hypothetical protein [Crocinitomix sp.]
MEKNGNSTIFNALLHNWGIEVLLCVWFIFVLFPQGPGITFDSVSFIEIGKNLFSTGNYAHTGPNGLEFASERFPLYTLLIAPLNGNTIGLFICQSVLFIGSLLVFRRFLKTAHAPKYFLLFFGFYVFIANYYSVWTESLYGLLMLLIINQIQKESGKKAIKYIAVLLVLLCLTRLVGIVIGGALTLAYFIKKKPKSALITLLAVLLTVGFWVLYGKLVHDSQARFIHYNPISTLNWLAMPRSIGSFLLPPSANDSIRIILGCLLCVLPALFIFLQWSKRESIRLIEWFLVIHFYAYIVFIWVSIALIDACIPVEFRTLFPLYLNLLALLVVYQTTPLFTAVFKSKIKYILPKILILLLIYNGYETLSLRNNGTGYNSAQWDDFKFKEEIKLTDASVVFTNDQAAVNYCANYGQHLKLLNEKYNLHSLIKNESYQETYDETIASIASNPKTKIIWVRNGITQDIYPSYEELKADPRLKVIYDDWLCLILESAD